MCYWKHGEHEGDHGSESVIISVPKSQRLTAQFKKISVQPKLFTLHSTQLQ